MIKSKISNLNPAAQYIELELLSRQIAIESWFRDAIVKESVPLTCSIDIRNSGFKISSVDANLFPSGFNNLNGDLMPMCVQAALYTISQKHPSCKRILIIPENYTRNLAYYDSVFKLQQIFSLAGYDVRVGQIEDIQSQKEIHTTYGILNIFPVSRVKKELMVDNFKPCLIVLNRDMSEGIPEALEGITQSITPPIQLGWHTRQKTTHFKYYNEICKSFANHLGLEPWLFHPLYRQCDNVDFMQSHGIDNLMDTVNDLLNEIRVQYKIHNIKETPFVAIKADSGTYGMGVMMVEKAEQLKTLNRKQRTRMSVGKGGQSINRVIVQEGIYSFETIDNFVAEPVVYLIGHSVVGGFYRVHKKKGIQDNLNAPGMEFKALAFDTACNTPDPKNLKTCITNRFYMYGVIARLAMLAAMKEIQAVK